MSPDAQTCFTLVDTCAKAMTEYADWKILAHEGDRVVLIELIAGPQSIPYFIGKQGCRVAAMRVILDAAVWSRRKVYYRVEDW